MRYLAIRLPHLDDPAAVCARLARALKPGGRVLVVHFANGRKLSRQTWGILPKMREVDVFLRADPARQTWATDGDRGVTRRLTAAREMYSDL